MCIRFLFWHQKYTKKKQRVRIIEYWIETARESFNIGNFNSLMAIIAGLNMSPISRLKKTVCCTNVCGNHYKCHSASNTIFVFNQTNAVGQSAVGQIRGAGTSDGSDQQFPQLSVDIESGHVAFGWCHGRAAAHCHTVLQFAGERLVLSERGLLESVSMIGCEFIRQPVTLGRAFRCTNVWH